MQKSIAQMVSNDNDILINFHVRRGGDSINTNECFGSAPHPHSMTSENEPYASFAKEDEHLLQIYHSNRDRFSPEEQSVLDQYLLQFRRLVDGEFKAHTDARIHFLRVMNSGWPPRTIEEIAFKRLLDFVAAERNALGADEIELSPPGTRPYPQTVGDKFDIEYEKEPVWKDPFRYG